MNSTLAKLVAEQRYDAEMEAKGRMTLPYVRDTDNAPVCVCLDGKGLSRKQRSVISQRLQGRTFGAIAERMGVSRQAVHGLEKWALRKLGWPSCEAVLASIRMIQAEFYRERGRVCEWEGLHRA